MGWELLVDDVMGFVGGWPGVIAIIIGLAGIAYGIYARSHPKSGTLAYRLVSQPLLATAAADLVVNYKGQSVAEPQLVTLEVFNLGPDDLAPGDLVGGHLKLESDPPLLLAVLEGGDLANLERAAGGVDPASTLSITPGILKKGESFRISILAEGNDLVRARMIDRLSMLVEGKSGKLSSSYPQVFQVAARMSHFRVVNRSRIGSVGFAKSLARGLRSIAPSHVALLGVEVPVKLDQESWARVELERVTRQPSAAIDW